MNKYIIHFIKIFYILIFSSAVWFISFTIFPENQVIKLEVGEESPTNFYAPRYLSVVDANAITTARPSADTCTNSSTTTREP